MRIKKRNLEYRADLLADLRASAEFAAEYLSAAYADSRGAFLVAMRDVIEARKGIAKVAAQAKVNRESLYRTLSEAGNPRLSTLNSIWGVLGFEVQFKPKVRPTATLGSHLVPTAYVAAATAEFQNLATSAGGFKTTLTPASAQVVGQIVVDQVSDGFMASVAGSNQQLTAQI